MIFVYIGLASVVLSLLLLWAVGKFAGQRTSVKAGKIDVGLALRELLIAKAEGRIDNEEFERRQASLHASVLQTPQAASPFSGQALWRWFLPLALVLAAGGIYWGFMANKGVDKPSIASEFAALSGGEKNAQAGTGGDLNTAVKKLADKMQSDPNNGEGWLLLAKTYGELRRYAEAASAYEKAAAILPADATMLADWADAYVMAQDRKWDDQARKIVKRALSADPKHVKTLALAGSEAFDRGDYKGAIEFWKRMKAAAAPDSMDGKLADANIAEANNMLSGKKPSAAPVAEMSAVAGSVTVSPKLRGKIGADDTVFVIAKSVDGAGPPLAVKRFKGSDLPLQFQLDDSSAIMPGRLISQSTEVVVTAKVSKSGQADQQAGDIYTTPVKARLGSGKLKIELDQVR